MSVTTSNTAGVGVTAGRRREWLPVRAPAVAGLAAPGLFFAVMTLLGLVRPGYSAVATAGSNLSLGSTGP